jgi:integrase/recombinase XerC
VDVDALLATYREWLGRQALATRSRDAYAAQVARFLGWLVSSQHGARALADPHVRDWAVRDYKRHVKTDAHWAPASVNQALAAIDNFYRSLGAGRPDVPREDLPQLAPRALEEDEQRRFLRAVEASPSPRDRAIATVWSSPVPVDRG